MTTRGATHKPTRDAGARYNERFGEDPEELIDAYEPEWDCRNGSSERSV